MKTGSMPCHRCHRLKSTNNVRYCARCAEEVRAMEKRRPAPAAMEVAEPKPKNAIVFIEPNLD
jgi:hypothetical protein